MKRISAIVSVVVLAGSLASTALASEDGVLEKEDLGDNYCHMKFHAIREATLASTDPQLKAGWSGDVIDFYGPCDEGPTSKDQVTAQRLDQARHPALGYLR